MQRGQRTWGVVLAPPSRMQVRGLTKEMLAPGTRATVVGYPHRNIVLLVGSAFMFDLRLLGLTGRVKVTDMAAHLLPRARLGLGIVVPSGLLMFVAHASDWGTSLVFFVKVGLITLAILNTFVFHGRTARSIRHWNQDRPMPPGAKGAAVVSLTMWTAAIAAGRLLAYF